MQRSLIDSQSKFCSSSIGSFLCSDLDSHRSHLEKGLVDLHGQCVVQRNQIRTLRAENDKLQKEFELQKALHALSGAPQSEGTSADATELRNKCAALQQDLEKSKKFTSTQNSCIIELNAKLSAAQERLKTAEGCTAAPGEQPSDSAELRTELTQKEYRVLALEADVAKEKKRNQEKDAKIQELSNQLAQAKQIAQIEAPTLNKAHLAGLQAEREKTAEANRRLEDAIRVRRKQEEEITALERAKEEMDDEMLGLRDQLRQTKERLEKAAEDLEWAEGEKGDLEEDLLEIMRETGLSARDSFDSKKKRIAQLEQDLASTKELLEGCQAEQTDDANKMEKLEERLASTRQKLNEANGQKKSLQNRVTSLSNAEKKLKKEMETLRAENRDLRSASEQQSSSHKDSGDSSTHRGLRDENDRLKKELRKSAERVEELGEETQDLERQLEDAQQQRTAAESQVFSLEKEIAKLKDAYKKLEADKKEAGRRANVATYDMVKEKEAVLKLGEEIKDLTSKIESLEWEKKDLAARLVATDAERSGTTGNSAGKGTPSVTGSASSSAVRSEEQKPRLKSSQVSERSTETRKGTPSKAAAPAGKRTIDDISKSASTGHRTSPAAKSSSASNSRVEQAKSRKVEVGPSEVIDISEDDVAIANTDDQAQPPPSILIPPPFSPTLSVSTRRSDNDDRPNEALSEEDWQAYARRRGILREFYPVDKPICRACS